MICIGLGSISLVVNLVLKFIKITKNRSYEEGMGNLTANPLQTSNALKIRRSQKRIETHLARNTIL